EVLRSVEIARFERPVPGALDAPVRARLHRAAVMHPGDAAVGCDLGQPCEPGQRTRLREVQLPVAHVRQPTMTWPVRNATTTTCRVPLDPVPAGVARASAVEARVVLGDDLRGGARPGDIIEFRELQPTRERVVVEP